MRCDEQIQEANALVIDLCRLLEQRLNLRDFDRNAIALATVKETIHQQIDSVIERFEKEQP